MIPEGPAHPDEAGGAGYGPSCPVEVARPVMSQRWERLTFVHWSFDPAVVQRRLPAGLRVDTYGGAAWVGLVPFAMRVATPGGRDLPWATRFLETNVRTYVLDRTGRRGVWFFSLDAARLGAVVLARTRYRLPYFWSRLSLTPGETAGVTGVTAAGRPVVYRCRRAALAGPPVTSRVAVRVGASLADHELDERDHFLTARWGLFAGGGARCRFTPVSHPSWPLHRAELLDLDDHLITAAGLPSPRDEPLVHHSPGVDVAVGRSVAVGPDR